MDDLLDKKDTSPVGGPHPHAGFETVTLLLEGEVGDDAHRMEPGDLQMMTAGSGIVHTESITKAARMRLLQLWLNLPKKERWTRPRVQDMRLAAVPQKEENGMSLRLYSGDLAGLHSPLLNHTPVLIADVKLKKEAAATLEIPASYNTMLYVLDGSIEVGEEGKVLNDGQVGWLSLTADTGLSDLKVRSSEGGRFVLYGGQPLGEPVVSHGPFIADANEDIIRLYADYRHGKLKHISTVDADQRIVYSA